MGVAKCKKQNSSEGVANYLNNGESGLRRGGSILSRLIANIERFENA